MRFFYTDANGQAMGPVEIGEIERLLEEGAIHSSSLVVEENGTEWRALGSAFQVEMSGSVEPPPLPPNSIPSDPSSAPQPHHSAPHRHPAPYRPPGSSTHTTLPLPNAATRAICGTATWALVVGIAYWILLAVSLYSTISLLFMASSAKGPGSSQLSFAFGGIVLLPLAVYLLPAIKACAFGSAIRAVRAHKDQNSYLATLRHQIVFFRFLAIAGTVVMAGILLLTIFA